ncbi:MAG: serine hydrolase domain-containing protein [Devosia sp.]
MRILLAALITIAATAVQSETLTALTERIRSESGATAILVAVRDPSGTIESAAAGTSLPGEAASTDMRFRYGFPSITAMTTILLQLVDEGVVGLDDPLADTLPDYPAADTITLRMLADSTSGYADFVDDEGFVATFYANPFYVFPRDEVLSIAFARGLLFDPGTEFHYSHANYIVLGEALQVATGQTMEALANTRVLAKLDVPSVAVAKGARLAEPALEAYATERGVYENSTAWSPSWTSYTGLFNGNIEDLTVLFEALATGATLSPEGLSELIAQDKTAPSAVGNGMHFGFGIIVSRDALEARFSYGGYEGLVSYDRTSGATIAVVTTFGPESSPEDRPSDDVLRAVHAAL